MKVGFDGRVLQDHFPGIGRYLDRIVRTLPGKYPDSSFTLFVDESQPNSRFDFEDYRRLGLTVRPITGSLFSPIGQVWAARLIDRERLDLVHASYFLTPVGIRTPLVATIHDVIPLRFPDSLPSRFARLTYRPLLRRVLRRARRIIVDSQWVISELRRFGLSARGGVSAVPLAVDSMQFPKTGSPPAGSPIQSPFLLYVGIDKPLKNLPMLVRAYQESGVPWPLVLAGPRDSRFTATSCAIAELGLEGKVIQLGAVDEATLKALYRGAGGFVFPSLAEGFGLPPLEAMGSGVPVICSNSASLPEVTGDAVLSLPADDQHAWALAMQSVVSDSELRARLSRAGLARAALFTWERTAEMTYQVFESVVRERA